MILHEEKKEVNFYETKKDSYRNCNNVFGETKYKLNKYSLKNSIVLEGCIINGRVENSVVYDNVYIGKNTVIRDSVIMPNVRVGDNSIIERVLLPSGTCVDNNSVIANNEEFIAIKANEHMDNESILEFCG